MRSCGVLLCSCWSSSPATSRARELTGGSAVHPGPTAARGWRLSNPKAAFARWHGACASRVIVSVHAVTVQIASKTRMHGGYDWITM